MDARSKVTLSLEPVYKDDNGVPFPKLHSISSGETLVHTYEPPHDPAKALRKTLAQLVLERGGDLAAISVQDLIDSAEDGATKSDDDLPSDEPKERTFSPVELQQMRFDMANSLNSAMSDVHNAIDLINLLLTTTNPELEVTNPAFIPSSLTTTTVPASAQGRPAALPSVQALRAQLVVGTKHNTLQSASNIFTAAAERTTAIIESGEKYWDHALRLRAANWTLVAAPLRESLSGHIVTKGMDSNAMDFWIAFGLEHSAPQYLQRALASLADGPSARKRDPRDVLDYPMKRPHKRLRVTYTTTLPDGTRLKGTNESSFVFLENAVEFTQLLNELSIAQQEVVEMELYRELIVEASSYFSSAAKTSERMITVEAARDVELIFDLVDPDTTVGDSESTPLDPKNSLIASLIRHSMILLLLRLHRIRHHNASMASSSLILSLQRTRQIAGLRPQRILAPIVSLIQYHSFVNQLWARLHLIQGELVAAGIPCELSRIGVGEDMSEVLLTHRLLSSEQGIVPPPPIAQHSIVQPKDIDDSFNVGGESVLRIGKRPPMKLGHSSTSNLNILAHLPQATIPIHDTEQLHQFLVAESSKCILEYLKDKVDEDPGSILEEVPPQKTSGHLSKEPLHWFVDNLEGTLVGDKWATRIQLQVTLDADYKLSAVAIKSTGSNLSNREVFQYPPKRSPADDDNVQMEERSQKVTLEEWMRSFS